MCNTIDFFTIYNHKPNIEQVIANNFTSLRIIVFKFNGISQCNEQSKEVVSVLNSFQFQTLYFCSLVYAYECFNILIRGHPSIRA